MRSLLTRFVALPRPIQAGLMLVAGGSIIGALYMLLSGRALFVMLIGVAVVVALLVAYRAMLKRRKTKKAAQMERGVAEHAAATPTAGGAPAERARMDDLRKSFEDGVAKFRSVGKNLYELPWYVMVGESGSGKTEAIRHCNIGFPPGLQDRLQGTGGTMNMNWWFTDNAVLLDTAGRLMFENSSSGEWKEFLKLLRTHRYNCPINGMLLVIPADSLIKDSAEEIEHKGSLIAQQLDQIQRELGVRFPVFVVVTKCDLVTGFREFFESLHDPELQHQILGWSNPDPLDQTFTPSLLDDHMDSVMKQLHRRRLRLLMDPVHTEDTHAGRADQVDALYAFPASLKRLMPRLRRYLEMVFVAGAWSAKPLFLRGIYFTSSMREGSALDEDLAEMIGVPADSLPDGHVWATDRAFFLRDTFTAKVFKEKGLVTRSANAGRTRRVRRSVVMGFGFLSVLLLILFTWLGSRSLKRSIGHHRDFWTEVAEENWETHPIVGAELYGSTTYEYRDTTLVVVGGKSMKLNEFQEELLRRSQAEIHIPWVFRFAATLGKDIDDDRARAHRVILTDSVLRPVVMAARHKMIAEETPWSLEATEALVQMLRLEAELGRPGGDEPLDLGPLFGYVLKEDQRGRYLDNGRDVLTESLAWSYDHSAFDGSDRRWGWLSLSLGAGTNDAHSAVYGVGPRAEVGGVNRFIAHWADPTRDAQGVDAALLRLLQELFPAVQKDLVAYRQAELQLLKLPEDCFGAAAGEAPATMEELTAGLAQWNTERFRQLREAKGVLDQRLADIRAALNQIGQELNSQQIPGTAAADVWDAALSGPDWLANAYGQTSRTFAGRKQRTFNDLLTVLEGRANHSVAQVAWLEAIRAAIETAKEKLESSVVQADLEGELGVLGADLFATAAATEKLQAIVQLDAGEVTDPLRPTDALSLFRLRYLMYALADAQVATVDKAPDPGLLPAAIKAAEQGISTARADTTDLWTSHGKVVELAEDSPLQRAPALTSFALRLAERSRIHALLEQVLSRPADADRVREQVAAAAAAMPSVNMPLVPMTRLEKDPESRTIPAEFHPEAAKAVLAGWQTAGRYIRPVDGQPDVYVLQRDRLAGLCAKWESACDYYVADYYDHWTVTVPGLLTLTAKDWPSYIEQIQGVSEQLRRVPKGLEDASAVVLAALKAVEPFASSRYRSDFSEQIKALTAASADLARRGWVEDQSGILDKWAVLPSDVSRARARILGLTGIKLIRDYLAYVDWPDEPVVKAYLQSLTSGALEALAKASQADAREAWDELRDTYMLFPLVTPAPGEKELSAEDMERVRELLTQVGAGLSAPAPSEQDTGTLAQGADTRHPQVNKLLKQLRQLQLSDAGRDLVERLWMIASMVPAGEAGEVKLFLPGREEQASTSFYSYYAGGLRLEQQGKLGRLAAAAGDEPVPLGDIEYGRGPGDAKICVYRYPTDVSKGQPTHTIALTGPWSPVRMLHTAAGADAESAQSSHTWEVVERSADGKEWLVKLTVDDGAQGSERSVVLGLSFPGELPRIDQWPTKAQSLAGGEQ